MRTRDLNFGYHRMYKILSYQRRLSPFLEGFVGTSWAQKMQFNFGKGFLQDTQNQTDPDGIPRAECICIKIHKPHPDSVPGLVPLGLWFDYEI